MTSARVQVVIALFLVAATASACSDPEAKKRAHVAKGDAYVAEKRDEFAAIEYASAIKIDPKFGQAHLKLRSRTLSAPFPCAIQIPSAARLCRSYACKPWPTPIFRTVTVITQSRATFSISRMSRLIVSSMR